MVCSSRSVALGLLLACACGDRAAREPADAAPRADAASAIDAAAPVPDAAIPPRDAGPPDCDARGSGCVPAAGEPACGAAGLRVLRVSGWPGGGIQVALLRRDRTGAPITLSDGSAIDLAMVGHDPLDTRVVPRAVDAGLTAIVIVPSADPARHRERLQAARALAFALPDGERIGVWLGADSLPMVAELTERREHAIARIDALPPSDGRAIDAAAWTALAQRLSQVGGAVGALGRSLVVVGELDAPALEPSAVPAAGRTALMQLFLGEAGAGKPGLDRAADAARFGGRVSPAAAGRLLAGHIAELRAGVAVLGACGAFAGGEPLALEVEGAGCALNAPSPPAHLSDEDCSAHAAARDDYPLPETIDLELSEDALALHDAYAEQQNEGDFPVSVVLGRGAPIPARAHFRGQTSLECARKNYSVNLQGQEPRRLLPDVADDEFYLISMCKEPYYFRQVIASRIMQALGLFPLDQRYVRLRVAGRELGVYLLMEKPHEALRADQAELSTVVRRRMDASRKAPESKYPDPADDPEGAAEALRRYRELAAAIDAVAPEELHAVLSDALDFDGYLRWMALNTYLQCGDYVDETFFYASPELGAPGSGLYFRNHGWDADDLFANCHHKGRYAYVDPYDIVHCAEGDLDRSLFVSSDVYARFIAELRTLVVHTFPPHTIEALLGEVRDDLFAVLQDDAVCGAMGELVGGHPEAASCAQMRPIIESAMESFVQQARDRAALLQARIEAWRAAQ